MSNKHKERRRAAALAACLLLNASAAPAAPEQRTPAGPDAAAVIVSLVVNGEKKISSSAQDVELIRAGTSAPAPFVEVETKLHAGDRIRTKQGDQVELRYPKAPDGKENVVYLDSETEVEIGSLCVRSGRVLAWVGVNFKICVGNTNLGVRGTEFEVHYREDEALKVAVFDGQVELKPADPAKPLVARRGQNNAAAPAATPAPAGQNDNPIVVAEKMELVVTPEDNGQRVESKPLRQDEGEARINYWSGVIIKADAPGAADKAFLNYTDPAVRNREFAEARFKALWEDDAASRETLGKVYNDWDEGHKASQELSLAAQKNPTLLRTAHFRTNLGEAARLNGDFATALSNLDTALRIGTRDTQAAYLKGKVFLDQYEHKPAETAFLEEAITNLKRADRVDTAGTALNRGKVQEELNESVRKIVADFQSQRNDWVSGEKWWCQKDAAGSAIYTGQVKFDSPELRELGLNVSGSSVIQINGNQFTLTSGGKTITGRIFGKTTGTYTTVFMVIDNPRGASHPPVTLFFQDLGSCGRLKLKSVDSEGQAHTLSLRKTS